MTQRLLLGGFIAAICLLLVAGAYALTCSLGVLWCGDEETPPDNLIFISRKNGDYVIRVPPKGDRKP